MIYIDTDRLLEVMNTLEVANNSVDEANQYLMQITTHNNWGCKERYVINEYTLKCRQEARKIQESSNSFYQSAKQVAREFVETENGISKLFGTVESIIGKILSVSGKIDAGIYSSAMLGILNIGNFGEHTGNSSNFNWKNVLNIPDDWEKVVINEAFGTGSGGGGFRTGDAVETTSTVLETIKEAINIVDLKSLEM